MLRLNGQSSLRKLAAGETETAKYIYNETKNDKYRGRTKIKSGITQYVEGGKQPFLGIRTDDENNLVVQGDDGSVSELILNQELLSSLKQILVKSGAVSR